MEKQTLHFRLPHLHGQEGLVLHAHLQEYALTVHTPATRLLAQAAADAHPAELTHYIEQLEVRCPRAALLYVTAPAGARPTRPVVAMEIQVPEAGRAAARARREEERQLLAGYAEEDLTDFKRWLRRPDYPLAAKAYNPTCLKIAVALLFQHPNLLNLSEDKGLTASYIKGIIEDAILLDSGSLVAIIEELGDDWQKSVPVLGEVEADGSRKQMMEPGAEPGDPPVPLFTNELHPDVEASMQEPLIIALREVYDSEFLRNKQWTEQAGVVGQVQPDRSAPQGELLLQADKSNESYTWSLTNLTPSPGLVVNPAVRYEPGRVDASLGRWRADGFWDEKTPAASPLTPALASSFEAGRLQLVITAPGYPQGQLRVPMVPAPAQPGEDVTVELRLGEEGADFLPAVTAAFSLDPSRKMLEYEFRSSYLGTEATAVLHLLAADGTTTPVFDLAICNEAYGDYDGTLYVTCTNHWLRHLSAYVQFLDGNGQPIVPTDWPSTEWASIGGVFEKIFGCEPSKKFLALLPPVGLLCGMIVLDNPTTLKIQIPRNAESVRLLWGGLGMGEYDNDVCLMGVLMTSVMELAVPTIMLASGAASDDEPGFLDKLILDKKIIKQLLLAAVAAGFSGTYIALKTRKTGDVGPVLTSLANMMGPLLFKTGLKAHIMRKAGQAALLNALPLIGQAFRIYSAVVNISKLVHTTLAVLQSPFYYRTEIKRAMNLDVEIAPGPLHKFPALARRYRVMVTYDKSATVQIMDGDLPRLGVLSDPFHVQFYEVPAGGRLRIFVFLYAANGWQAGQGVSDWLPAKPQNGNLMLVKDVQVLENEIPLTAASVYAHQARLAYQQGSHVWLASSQPPTATPYTGGGTAGQVLRRESITLAQSPAALGYCWQAMGLHIARDTDPSGPPVDEPLYTAQSISILADPEAGYATPAVGYSQPVGLVYDLSTSSEGDDGRNFFMQGSAGGEFHLRQVRPVFNRKTGKVQPPKFPAHATESWGRFPQRLDCYVVHPQGYVIGLVSQPAKLFICQLPPAALPDDQAPRATLASGEGVREGLLLNPHALAVGLDGAILVLEGKRIQAFDLYGNPVPYFRDPARPDQKSSALYLTQPAGTFYLDLTVEAKGYLYVLSRRGAGRQPADYHLTIYTPDGAQLVDTPQVAAERLTVGLDRSVYTLNYETLQGHQGRPEPSISQWVPPAPAL